MKKQSRPAEPKVLSENCQKWTKQWTELRRKNPRAKFSWYKCQGKTAREWILPLLREMNQRHCSFCDVGQLDDHTTEPIEHFKPKSKYYEDAYRWENLYYACPACQASKLEQWSDDLIAPDDPGYTFKRFFRYDFTTGDIEPNPKATIDDRNRAQTTIRIFDLNSSARIRRRKEYQREFAKTVEPNIDTWPYREFIQHPPDSD